MSDIQMQNLALAQTLAPAAVMQHFAAISNIPRGSGNERGVADHLVAFAEKNGLFCYRDEANNVLIKAPATPGRENAPALLLQGHTDMVCEKNADTVHDFENDPIRLMVDGEWLCADGTTLGGDNGIAVSYMMAILESKEISHPALECLFTTSEEVGMEGIVAFDHSLLTARHMVNLDSEGEGLITAGCAGGVRTDLFLPTPRTMPGEGDAYVKVTLSGLCGGHSGEDINRGRTGANVLLVRMLKALREQESFSLVTLSGGSKDNAIPRECEAVVCLPAERIAPFAMAAMLLADTLAEELVDDDRECVVNVERVAAEDVGYAPMDADATTRVLCTIGIVPQGVLKMSSRMEKMVEYSRNVGVIRTEESGVKITMTSRSGIESQLDHAEQSLTGLAALAGGTVTHRNRYPGWDFAPVSRVRQAYIEAFTAQLGYEPQVIAIHAGLESGYLKKKLPDMDIIAVGPDMKDLHSPDEKFHLPSLERVWKVLLHLLAHWE